MKSNIPMPVVIAAAVAVLLVMIFIGMRAFNQEPKPSGVGADGAKINTSTTGSTMMSGSIPGQPNKAEGKAVAAPPMAPANN